MTCPRLHQQHQIRRHQWPSAHGSISVSPETAKLLGGLVQFYDHLALHSSLKSDSAHTLKVTGALRRVAQIYHRLGMFAESREA